MKKILCIIGFLLMTRFAYGTDNVVVTAGTGTTIAAEDVSGVKYQKIKLIDSTASSTTPTGVAANPLQVSLANTAANGTAVAVSLASVPSHAVTNAGTFATQATLQAGTAEIGKLAAGIAEIGNVKNSGTFAVQSATTLNAETTKVIGVVRTADGSGNLLTSTTNALDVNLKSGNIANTSFAATQGTPSSLKTESHLYDSSTNGIGSTSNALDINIKSGNPTTITATQATGTNLHTVLDTTSTTAVTQGTATNLKAEAECYQGGTAVSSTAPLYTTNAIDAGLATSVDKVKVVAYTAAATAQTVVAITNGKIGYITDVIISASAAGSIYIFDDTDSSTAEIVPPLTLAANGGCVVNFKKPFVTSAVSHTIKWTSGAGAAGSILVKYYEI